ncbi:MAG: hypothetical protein II112_04230, partial [Bacteroidales bacterium]|nr:hypothetical protein [Bacteroidales bacterium]
ITMPKMVRINLTGKLSPWVAAKDIILEVLRRMSVKGGGQQPLQDGEQDGNGDRIEIIVDIELVGPHPPAAERLADRIDGVARPQAAAEGVAVGRKRGIIAVQKMGQQLERPGLFQTETVDGPFLPRSHLVDALALGNARSLPFHQGVGNRQILFLRHIRIGILEQGPGETALHQAMRQEFIPRRLTFQLSENAVHAKEKRKKGKGFESAKLLFTGRVRGPAACKAPERAALRPKQAQPGLHPLFPKRLKTGTSGCGPRHNRVRWASACRS